MWDETLIESGQNRQIRKRLLSLPVSAVAHAAVVGIVIGLSYWTVEGVPAPPPREPLWVVKVHLGPPPAPIKQQKSKSNGSATSARTLSETNPVAQQPVSNPATTQSWPVGDLTQQPSAGVISGVEGGLTNGEGGALGSEFTAGEGQPIPITAEIQQPVLIKKITPIYPPVALRARIQGLVLLQAIITKTGTVAEVTVIRSTNPLLTQSAVDAVSQWIYKPALLHGRPVAVYFNVTVEFRIR